MTPSQQMVVKIRNAVGVVRRHSVLIACVFSVLMAVSVVAISQLPRKFTATANVLIVNGNSRNDPTLSSPDLPSIVGSTAVLERVQRRLGLVTPLLTMKKNLVAKPPAYRSGIMRIQYTDSDRDRAATIVNGVADELASYYKELSTARYDDDLRALDVEISKQKKRLESIDEQLRARGLDLSSDADPDSDASGAALTNLESQRRLANADLQGDIANAQAASVGARRDALQGDATYQQLQASLAKAASDLADARARYTGNFPGLSALQDRVNDLQAALKAEESRALSTGAGSPDAAKAQASVVADRAKVSALDGELDVEGKRSGASTPVELLRLERQEVFHEYQSVAARRATSLADRADALSLGSLEVVDRAIPSEDQAGMGPIRLTVIAGFIILIVAFGSAFLADQLDPGLRRAAQIERLYGRPIMATLTTSHRDTK